MSEFPGLFVECVSGGAVSVGEQDLPDGDFLLSVVPSKGEVRTALVAMTKGELVAFAGMMLDAAAAVLEEAKEGAT